MGETDRDAVERQIERAEDAAIHLPLSKPIIGKLCATSRALLAAKEEAEGFATFWHEESRALLAAKEEAEGFATFWHEESRALLADKEAAEAEAAALREKLQESGQALTGIERLYYTEGKDASWRAVMMRAVANVTLATLDQPKEGEDNG